MDAGFGAVLRQEREKTGKTLGEVARHLGVSVTYLSDVERDERPALSPDRIAAVAAFLGCSLDRLVAAAAVKAGAFKLPVAGLSPRGREVGAALQRGWNEFDDGFFEEVANLIEKKRGSDK